jgi:hypothetical protein
MLLSLLTGVHDEGDGEVENKADAAEGLVLASNCC